MGLKILASREFMASHILVIVGVILITVGLALGINIIVFLVGIWVGAIGLYALFGAALKKILDK